MKHVESILRMSVASEASPIRLVIGPSPWGFRNRSISVHGLKYHFRETAPGDSRLGGFTSVRDSECKSLLILAFYNSWRVLDDGHALVWRESTDRGNRRIIFDSFLLSSLQIVSDPLSLASHIREQTLGVAPLPSSEHWEFSCQLDAETHLFPLPYNWSCFEETLVLADHAEPKENQAARAIFAFDWNTHRVRVFPQDWFNTGDYDLGYQWITRVWRCSDGGIMGEGIRLGRFELDRTNRYVKTWLILNPF